MQATDPGLAGSPFAPEDTFTIADPGPAQIAIHRIADQLELRLDGLITLTAGDFIL